MLINTSLNINEQPMVNSPQEALHTRTQNASRF
jgi:predicted NodU family carbamoyl transferase